MRKQNLSNGLHEMRKVTTPVSLDELHAIVLRMKDDGYSLMTMSSTDLGEHVDILYHFGRNRELRHLRLTVPKGKPVPSITPVYSMATLAEREMCDCFGLCFDSRDRGLPSSGGRDRKFA